MAVGNPSRRVTAYDTASVALATQAVAADENTKGVKMGPYNQFGFWVDISAASGTSPTLDIKFEWSEDSTDGVDGTWAALRENRDGSATQSALAQITTTTGAFGAFFVNPCSGRGWVRAKFDVGGTSPSYTVDNAYWVLKDGAAHGS